MPWTNTAALNTPRSGHRATLLSSGKVLVSGGYINSVGGLASAEVYDPKTELWTETESMHVPRTKHTASLLPDGKVLVAGTQIVHDGAYTGSTPGVVLRAGRDTDTVHPKES